MGAAFEACEYIITSNSNNTYKLGYFNNRKELQKEVQSYIDEEGVDLEDCKIYQVEETNLKVIRSIVVDIN